MKYDHRYEIKFVLNEREMSHALAWLNMIGVKKSYANRVINSLYFDNVAQKSVRDNLSGISNRNKVRLRWYGNSLSEDCKLSLEIKLREGRLGSKIIFPLSLTAEIFKKKNLYELYSEIFKKLPKSDFAHNSINDYLVPMILVKYYREYYEFSKAIRITIDKKISFYNAMQNTKIDSLKPMRYNSFVMEIKFPKELKYNVSNLLKPLLLSQKRHSKYMIGLSMLGYTKYI